MVGRLVVSGSCHAVQPLATDPLASASSTGGSAEDGFAREENLIATLDLIPTGIAREPSAERTRKGCRRTAPTIRAAPSSVRRPPVSSEPV